MTIGQLYSPSNVVVGQAACLVAPKNTPLPNIAKSALVGYSGDALDMTLFTQALLFAVTGPITAGSTILTYTKDGTAYAVASITATTETATGLAAKILTALAPLGALASEIMVTGGPVSAVATPFSIVLAERLLGGVWTKADTGITGGTLGLTSPLWQPVGATDQGWKFSSSKTTQPQTIEEQSAPILTTMQSQVFSIEGLLSEEIDNTLAITYNMVRTVVAGGAGIAGYTSLALTDLILEYAVALIMANAKGFPRWAYVPSNTCLGNVDTALRRAAGKHMYNAVFSSDCPVSSIVVQSVYALGT